MSKPKRIRSPRSLYTIDCKKRLEDMMRKLSWMLYVVVLSVLGSNAFAETIDVVRLKNGDVIKSVIVETIPNFG